MGEKKNALNFWNIMVEATVIQEHSKLNIFSRKRMTNVG